ncbi:helix-turn-helix domain-containing protein [Aerococcaceae bacterium zg-1292]
MKISYVNLWKQLEIRRISRKDFRKNSGIGSSTYTKLINDKDISTSSLMKICDFLDCELHEVASCIRDDNKE